MNCNLNLIDVSYQCTHFVISLFFFSQIVCERNEVYPLGCAVARAFPQYNQSSSFKPQTEKTIQVGFIFVGDGGTNPLTEEEILALTESCEGTSLQKFVKVT